MTDKSQNQAPPVAPDDELHPQPTAPDRKKPKRSYYKHVDRTAKAKEKFDDSSGNFATEIHDRLWLVRSFKTPNNVYDVAMNEWDVWTCTCKDYEFRHSTCKHIKLVLLEIFHKTMPHFTE